jgi:phenylpyruvate tautomerase PptA (4-oxalocrotonate tautomerase family)
MPYLEMNVSKKLTAGEKHELCDVIGNCMPLIPGKARGNTCMNIIDDRFMEYLGSAVPVVHIKLFMLYEMPYEAGTAFVKEMCASLSRFLGIPQERIMINFMIMDHWGINGEYKRPGLDLKYE